MVFGATALPLWQLLLHATDAVHAVRQGQSLNDALDRVPGAARPGTQALAFHGLRWMACAQVVASQLLRKPPQPQVDALITLALALMWPESEQPYAGHTLVNQAVTAVRQRKPEAAGLVNAVLRRFLREEGALVKAARMQPEALHHHPLWWLQAAVHDWPAHGAQGLRAAQEHPPMTLRARYGRCSAQELVQLLAHAGIKAHLLPETGPAAAVEHAQRSWALPQAVVLAQAAPVQSLPGFQEGLWSVQDAAAQLAAPLLLGGLAEGRRPGDTPLRVLDACAAPGGKTAHLLELAQGRCPIELLALDSDAQRLRKVEETLQRLGLGAQPDNQAQLKAADARDTASWWDGRPFDAILLDAPCSASGIVRRHPDIVWLRRPTDIAALATLQSQLLDALWPLLKPGGRLLFSTCSIFKAEGRAQIDAFLQRGGGSSALPDPLSPGHLLPLPDNELRAIAELPRLRRCDGFFHALMHKT